MRRETIGRSSRRWAANIARAVLLAALVQGLTPQVLRAQATDLWPTVTNIVGTADRMISYRHQQHSWQTSDGVIHIMVNRGSVPTGDSLALYSSYDGGLTWAQMFTLPGTDAFSTSDGMLTGSATTAPNLLLTYATAQSTGTIMYVYATYSSAGQSWGLSAPQVAFSAANIAASTPAFAADAAGNLWCAFTAQDLTTLQYEETAVYRAAKSSAWIPTGLVFGSINGTLQHSARPVPYNNGIGMLYQDGQTMYWAYRQTSWPLDAPWTTSTLYAGLPPYSQDPYGSHYSVVADAANNLHLALIANQQLIYMRFLSSTNAWGAPRPLTASSTNAAYSQATLAGGNLLLMANNLTSIVVFQSTNSGNTFALTQVLRHPASTPGSSLDYTNPRVESPSRASSPVPVFQQFVSGSTQSLMFFQVPVVK